MTMFRVFVSHNSKDAALIGHLQQAALNAGVELYIAEHDQQPGRQLSDKLAAQIRSCDALVTLLTRAGYDSHFVHAEIGFALGAMKPVIPLTDHALLVAHTDFNFLNGIEAIPLDLSTPEAACVSLSDYLVRLRRTKELQEFDRKVMSVAVGLLLGILAAQIIAEQQHG